MRKFATDRAGGMSCQRSEKYSSVHYQIGWPFSRAKQGKLTAKDAKRMRGGVAARRRKRREKENMKKRGRVLTADFADGADGRGEMAGDG